MIGGRFSHQKISVIFSNEPNPSDVLLPVAGSNIIKLPDAMPPKQSRV
jgi:hypothetical protein